MGKFGDHELKGVPGSIGVYKCVRCGLDLDARTDHPDVIDKKEQTPCEDKPARPAAK